MAEGETSPARNLGQFYERKDYAGLFRRLVIIAVDLGVLAGLYLAVSALDGAIRRDDGPFLSPAAFYSWLALVYTYLVVLEASPIGTLGFLLTGVRIVTLDGRRPSILRMTFRLLFWILGPINALVDLFWLTGDAYRQTLRDKFSGTLIIRKGAVPAGTGAIRLNRYQFLGYSFVFYEVDQTPSPGERATAV